MGSKHKGKSHKSLGKSAPDAGRDPRDEREGGGLMRKADSREHLIKEKSREAKAKRFNRKDAFED